MSSKSVSQLYDQYVQDLSCILDKHAPLVSSLKMKQCADALLLFSNKIMKICESFSSSVSCNTVHSPFDPPKLTVLTHVTQDEIAKIISKSPTKSCLLDPFPTFLIKECIDILLPSITKSVNFSLSEGLVPDGFKRAVVTPLIKKASLPVEDLKNYHPVSGLSFISKLMERVVAKQLVDHIHQHDLDNSYQSAYKPGHSTETALLSIKNDIHLSLSQGEATALVLLDLLAAFYMIDHSTLLGCLWD